MTDPRHTQAWRTLAAQVIAEEPICWLQIPGICTQRSTTADHIVPVSKNKKLALDRNNLHGACGPCNSSRKNTDIHPATPAALHLFD